MKKCAKHLYQGSALCQSPPKQFCNFQIISTFFKYLVLRPLIYLPNSSICNKETIILIIQQSEYFSECSEF